MFCGDYIIKEHKVLCYILVPYRTKRFTIFASHLPMHTHTHTHWWWQSFHARCWPDHREQHGVQCLAQGHFDTWAGKAGGIEPATPNVLTRDFKCCFILSLKILNYRYFRITVINFGVFTILSHLLDGEWGSGRELVLQVHQGAKRVYKQTHPHRNICLMSTGQH